MGDVTRREALLGMVGGAAAVAAGALGLPAAAAAASTPAGAAPGDAALEAARDAARRAGTLPGRRGDSVVCWARVRHCRSWDGHVYLHVDERLRGFAPVTAEGFAIAAACQAAARPVAAEVWGHEPEPAGAGRFAGAHLAMDRADLPGGATEA